MICTAWIESLNTHDKGREETYRSCQKHKSLSLHDLLYTGRHLLSVSFITSLKPNLCTALTTQNTTENNYIISRVQNATALRPNVFLIGIHRSLLTKNSRLSPPQTTAKVNCKLRSHYVYMEYQHAYTRMRILVLLPRIRARYVLHYSCTFIMPIGAGIT